MKFFCLNKLLSVLIVCALLISLLSVPSFADEEIFETSDGYTFTVDQLNLCWGDIKDIPENASQQDVIDTFYRKGFTSIEICSSEYDEDDYSEDSQEYETQTLTDQELLLLLMNVDFINPTWQAKETAINWAATYYPGENMDGQKGNAFQHAFWVMSMYYKTSPTFALNFAEAHESMPNNPILHKTMDLTNNQAAYDFCVSLNNEDADLTYEQIKNYAIDLVNSGSLIYIIQNYEYPAVIYVDRLTGLETGRTMATADLYAYTNSTTPFNIPDPIIRYTGSSIDFQGLLPGGLNE